jgi:hypothetical protein
MRALLLLMLSLPLLLSLLFTIGDACNVVIQWNNIALDAIRRNASSPPVASRALAMVNVAIHDAVASINRRYSAHNYSVPDADADASLDAAVVAAAYNTLTSLFPNQEDVFDQQQAISEAAFTDSGKAIADGTDVGAQVAQELLADRATDGTQVYKPYPGSDAPGMWRPTPPTYTMAENPQWADQRPWCMTRDEQFRPPPPPAIDSDLYVADHNQIFVLGAKYNATRTDEQTAIAEFWYDGPTSDTPPGTWQVVAEAQACVAHFDVPATTRLFALVAMSLADAAIMGWDAKFTYGQWRPITAIRFANTTNATTTPPLAFDPEWLPLLNTPPWPDYLSDRAMFGGAASQVLTRFFGDNVSITVAAANVTRNFTSFASAAFEQGQSRVFGGSHFNTSCVFGVNYGRLVGNWSFDNCLTEVVPPDAPDDNTTISTASTTTTTAAAASSESTTQTDAVDTATQTDAANETTTTASESTTANATVVPATANGAVATRAIAAVLLTVITVVVALMG